MSFETCLSFEEGVLFFSLGSIGSILRLEGSWIVALVWLEVSLRAICALSLCFSLVLGYCPVCVAGSCPRARPAVARTYWVSVKWTHDAPQPGTDYRLFRIDGGCGRVILSLPEHWGRGSQDVVQASNEPRTAVVARPPVAWRRGPPNGRPHSPRLTLNNIV